MSRGRKSLFPRPGPAALLAVLVAVVFVCEAVLMFTLAAFPELPVAVVSILDASLLLVAMYPSLYLLAYRPMKSHIENRARAEAEEKATADRLKDATEEIQALHRLLAICAHCKSIRDDDGVWHSLEGYAQNHLGVNFTHGVCPECLRSEYDALNDQGGLAG